MIYLLLFFEFFKTGLFAIGGGLATLPFLYNISATYGWFTEADLSNMIAIAESTPGPIGVNMATYAGIQTAGILGGMTATFALILPSALIIMMVSSLLMRHKNNPYVLSAMRVLRPTSMGLIATAFYSVVKVALLHLDWASSGAFWKIFNFPALALCAVLALICWRFKKLHPIVLVLVGAAAGVIFKL